MVTTQRPRTLAWLRLARVSNVPTVVSAVMTGAVISHLWTGGPAVWGVGGVGGVGGLGAGGAASTFLPPSLPRVLLPLLGLIAIYIGGMILNDALDADTDAIERPLRPIPSGHISRRSALIAAASLFVLGLFLHAMAGLLPFTCAFVIALAAAAYSLIHHRSAWAIVLLGLCRALIYPAAASAVDATGSWRHLAVPAAFGAVIGLYTIAFSLVARGEADPSAAALRPWSSRLPWAPLLLALLAPIPFNPSPTPWLVGALLVLAFWQFRAASLALGSPPRTIPAVLMWIAGFCLLDTVAMVSAGHPHFAFIPLACLIATTFAHRRIIGS